MGVGTPGRQQRRNRRSKRQGPFSEDRRSNWAEAGALKRSYEKQTTIHTLANQLPPPPVSTSWDGPLQPHPADFDSGYRNGPPRGGGRHLGAAATAVSDAAENKDSAAGGLVSAGASAGGSSGRYANPTVSWSVRKREEGHRQQQQQQRQLRSVSDAAVAKAAAAVGLPPPLPATPSRGEGQRPHSPQPSPHRHDLRRR